METIAVSELRANLMNVIKEVEHGSKLFITSRGKIVAKLVPPEDSQEHAKKRLKEIGESAKLHDIISPIDAQWESMK
ncbi:type II toxin-antitoxin system prevent-host-death family antitoxin [candidate division KSB1 bacterium]|nr:type II toxin-antitoxin system prevent-host-death family antitoxin [candidate division KSB1 bacterium]